MAAIMNADLTPYMKSCRQKRCHAKKLVNEALSIFSNYLFICLTETKSNKKQMEFKVLKFPGQ
jgi:hypothetical protein